MADESSRNRKRKESGSGDGKLSVEIRIRPASGKGQPSSTKQTSTTGSKGTSPSSRRKASDGGLKRPKMRGDDDKLAPPEGSSRAASPDRSGRKYGSVYYHTRFSTYDAAILIISQCNIDMISNHISFAWAGLLPAGGRHPVKERDGTQA